MPAVTKHERLKKKKGEETCLVDLTLQSGSQVAQDITYSNLFPVATNWKSSLHLGIWHNLQALGRSSSYTEEEPAENVPGFSHTHYKQKEYFQTGPLGRDFGPHSSQKYVFLEKTHLLIELQESQLFLISPMKIRSSGECCLPPVADPAPPGQSHLPFMKLFIISKF